MAEGSNTAVLERPQVEQKTDAPSARSSELSRRAFLGLKSPNPEAQQASSPEEKKPEKWRDKAEKVIKAKLAKAAEIGKRFGLLEAYDPTLAQESAEMKALKEKLLDGTMRIVAGLAAVDAKVRTLKPSRIKEGIIDVGLDTVAAIVESKSPPRPKSPAATILPQEQPRAPAKAFESADDWALRMMDETIDWKKDMGLELDPIEKERLEEKGGVVGTWTKPEDLSPREQRSDVASSPARVQPREEISAGPQSNPEDQSWAAKQDLKRIAWKEKVGLKFTPEEQQRRAELDAQVVKTDSEEFPVTRADKDLFAFGDEREKDNQERGNNRLDKQVLNGDRLVPAEKFSASENTSPIPEGVKLVDEKTGIRYRVSYTLPSQLVRIQNPHNPGQSRIILSDPTRLPIDLVRVVSQRSDDDEANDKKKTDEGFKVGDRLKVEVSEDVNQVGEYVVTTDRSVPEGFVSIQNPQGEWQFIPNNLQDLPEEFVLATIPAPKQNLAKRIVSRVLDGPQNPNQPYSDPAALESKIDLKADYEDSLANLKTFEKQLVEEKDRERARKPRRGSIEKIEWKNRQDELAQQEKILTYINKNLSPKGKALSATDMELLLDPESRAVVMRAVQERVGLNFIAEKIPSIKILVDAKDKIREEGEKDRANLLAGEELGPAWQVRERDREQRAAILQYVESTMRLDPLHDSLSQTDLVKLLGAPREEVLPEELSVYNERRTAVLRAIKNGVPLPDLLAAIPNEKGEYEFALPLDGLKSKNYYFPHSEHLSDNERKVWQKVIRVLQVAPARYGISHVDARRNFEEFDSFVERNTQDANALEYFQAALETEKKEEAAESTLSDAELTKAEEDRTERSRILNYIAVNLEVGPHRENVAKTDIAVLLNKRNRKAVLQAIEDGVPFYEAIDKINSLRAVVALDATIQAEKEMLERDEAKHKKQQTTDPIWKEGWTARQDDREQRYEILTYITENLKLSPRYQDITATDMAALFSNENREITLRAIKDGDSLYDLVDELREQAKQSPAERKGLVARTRTRYQNRKNPRLEEADTSLVLAKKIDHYLSRDVSLTEEARRDAVRMLTRYLKEKEVQEGRLLVTDGQMQELMDLYRAFYAPTKSNLALAA